MILSKVALNELLKKEYDKGFENGRKVNIIAEEAKLVARQREISLQVYHLEGACLTAKALYEHIKLAGVPDWVQRR